VIFRQHSQKPFLRLLCFFQKMTPNQEGAGGGFPEIGKEILAPPPYIRGQFRLILRLLELGIIQLLLLFAASR
jgi:hypothetical protein